MNEEYDEEILAEEVVPEDDEVIEDEEVVLPDDDEATEKLPNIISGFAKVRFCEEHNGVITASLVSSNPEPKTRFPTYHPATLPKMVKPGSTVMITGEIAQDQIWLPARLRGQLVPNGDEFAGAEVVTQFIKADQVEVMDVPEDFIARLHMYLEARIIELVGKGGSDRRNQIRQNRRGRRGRQRREQGVFNKALDEMTFRNSDLVHYASITGNGVEIRLEAFFSDYFNRSSLEQDVRVYLDIVPQWHTDTQGTVEIISKKTGRPMVAKVKVRGRLTSMPVIVHPYTLRAVIATRILDDNYAEVGPESAEEVIEDLSMDIRGHVGKISELNR